MKRCEGKGKALANQVRPPRAVGLVAFAFLTAVTAVTPSWAQPAGTAPPPQPAVSLPPKDILNPDAAPAPAGGANRPVASEADREIRRPAEASGSGENKPAGQRSTAETGSEARGLARQGSSRSFWQVSDLLPLAIVLGLVAAAAWAVKRYMPAKRLVTGSGVLEIMARMPLSSKQSLVLVKMGRQLILVGVSPERVNTLCIVDDPDKVAELIGRIASQAPNSATAGFGQSLDQQAGAFDETDEEPVFQGTGGVRGLLEKVKRLSRSEVS